MAKPQHVFLLVKGKAKLVNDARTSRAQAGETDAQLRVNAADYLLKRANISPSRLPSGLKIIEDAIRASKDRVDETTLGKVKLVIEDVAKIAKEYAKLDKDTKEAFRLVQKPMAATIRAPELTPKVGLDQYVSILDTLVVLLTILIKLRAKGTKPA